MVKADRYFARRTSNVSGSRFCADSSGAPSPSLGAQTPCASKALGPKAAGRLIAPSVPKGMKSPVTRILRIHQGPMTNKNAPRQTAFGRHGHFVPEESSPFGTSNAIGAHKM